MDCYKCKAMLKTILARPRPKELMNAINSEDRHVDDGNVDTSVTKIASNSITSGSVQNQTDNIQPALSPLATPMSVMMSTANVGYKETYFKKMKNIMDNVEVTCTDCKDTGLEAGARAFMVAPPTKIILCANRLRDANEMEEALVHELVHVYDFAKIGRDLSNCEQLAYSEVRAAREAECHYKSHLCSYFKSKCIKDTAINSTKSIFPSIGADCVERVFMGAYKDNMPFKKEETP